VERASPAALGPVGRGERAWRIGPGLVGKYLAGHRNVGAYIDLPLRLYPGINEQHSLVSKQFMRHKAGGPFVRHDLRVWESSVGKTPRLADDSGALMLGDAILDDWRKRTKTGTARVRAYYDIIPDRASELTLDPARKNEWGDPLPKLVFRDAPESVALRAQTEDSIKAVFANMAKAGNGTVLRTSVDNFQDHPAGGCRMGADPGLERRRFMGTRARSRESIRRRRADLRDRELRERDPHVLCAVTSIRA
jgi:quinoprotein glucose dehydrogenase